MTQRCFRPHCAALFALVFSLTGLAYAAGQTTMDATHKNPQSDMTETLQQLALPPLDSTRTIIAALPQVQAARAGMAYSVALGQRLASGTYEWNLKIGTQQRRETRGISFAEQELAMERSIRIGRKSDTDRSLGEAGVAVGQAAYADTWHEVVRSLLKSWYDWQRERSASEVMTRQSALAQEQLRVAIRRVKAGEAPRMDQLMAQADFDRAIAAQQQASGREEVQRMELQKRYPGIGMSEANARSVTPDTQLLPADVQDWQATIMSDNHEIELAEAELRVAQFQGQRAQLDTRPDLQFGVRASRERGGQETVMGVYVTIPLSGPYREADHRAALAQIAAAEQRLEQTRQRVGAAAARVVLQAGQNKAVWARLNAVQKSMAEVSQMAVKAYGLGEMSLTEALQARRISLEAALAADTARWDALESVSRVLVDAHRLWAADEPNHDH